MLRKKKIFFTSFILFSVLSYYSSCLFFNWKCCENIKFNEMTESKSNKANSPMSNYNLAVVTHCPSQQTATIVVVEKPSVFNRIFKTFGISDKDEKPSNECITERQTFFICKSFAFLFSSVWRIKKTMWPDSSAENYL